MKDAKVISLLEIGEEIYMIAIDSDKLESVSHTIRTMLVESDAVVVPTGINKSELQQLLLKNLD